MSVPEIVEIMCAMYEGLSKIEKEYCQKKSQ